MKKSITQQFGLLGKPLLLLLFTALFWPTTASATHCIDTLDFEFTIDNNSKTVKFESTVSSNALALKWDFGDGSGSNDPNVKHTYDSAGYYKVCLTAYGYDSINNTRCSTTVCKRFKIIDCDQLKADFSITTSDLLAKFEAKSNSKTVVYGWTFGDNNTSRGQAVKHTYGKEGKYKVCLVAKDTVTGCITRVCKEVKVEDPCNLKADFKYETDDMKIRVKGEANESGVLYFWSWGDGTSSTGQTAKHKYDKEGVYEVCLVVFNPKTKCKTFVCKRVKIEKPCNLKAKMKYTINGNKVRFKARSNSNNVVYGWSFGDGDNQRGNPVRHEYAKPGVYKVTLTAKDTVTGCVVTVSNRLIINAKSRKGTTAALPGVGSDQTALTEQTSSVEELEAPSFDWNATAYPVPASTNVDFSADKTLASVTVFSTGGTEVLTSDLTDSKNLDISTLPTGYYFAHLTAADGSVKIVKFVKSE